MAALNTSKYTVKAEDGLFYLVGARGASYQILKDYKNDDQVLAFIGSKQYTFTKPEIMKEV